jgi:hypothetical protein
MNKIYKYSFYLLILSCLILINLWNISKSRLQKELNLEKEKNEKRATSLFQSNLVLKREIKDFVCYSIIDGKESRIINKDSTYLIALLSDFDCAKCQENELLKLQSIKSPLDKKGIKAICLTIKEKVNQISSQMKYLKLSIPLYYVSDDLFKKRLSFDDEYPQIVLIEKGLLVSSFKPISNDVEFSEMYYKVLLTKL